MINHWKVPPRRNFFNVAKSTLTLKCFVLAIWQVMRDHYHTRTNFIKNMNAPGSNKATKRDDNVMRAYSSRDDRYAASKNLLLVDAQIPPPREKQVCFQTAPRGWGVWADTPTSILPGMTRKCKVRSKFWWFTGFCNSHYVSHFAAFFIDVGAKTSVAESCIYSVNVRGASRRN